MRPWLRDDFGGLDAGLSQERAQSRGIRDAIPGIEPLVEIGPRVADRIPEDGRRGFQEARAPGRDREPAAPAVSPPRARARRRTCRGRRRCRRRRRRHRSGPAAGEGRACRRGGTRPGAAAMQRPSHGRARAAAPPGRRRAPSPPARPAAPQRGPMLRCRNRRRGPARRAAGRVVRRSRRRTAPRTSWRDRRSCRRRRCTSWLPPPWQHRACSRHPRIPGTPACDGMVPRRPASINPATRRWVSQLLDGVGSPRDRSPPRSATSGWGCSSAGTSTGSSTPTSALRSWRPQSTPRRPSSREHSSPPQTRCSTSSRTAGCATRSVGLRTYAGVLAGESGSYADEVEGCYGVRPTHTDEAVFAAAHERLEELLPGDGPLAERYERWEDSIRVPTEQIERTVAAVIEEARAWTRGLVELPDGEGVVLEIVRDEPWLAFCDYLGDLRSRIAVNVDLPMSAIELLRARDPRDVSRPPRGALQQGAPARARPRAARGDARARAHAAVARLGGDRRRSRRPCCSRATAARRSPRSCTTPASSSISLTHSPSSGPPSRAGGRRSTRR